MRHVQNPFFWRLPSCPIWLSGRIIWSSNAAVTARSEPGSKPCCAPTTLRRTLVTSRPGPALIPPLSCPSQNTPERSSPAATSCWKRSAKAAWVRSGWPSRSQPVKRKVALKLIKAGMDSKSVLARFEAERQALAVMDHPNIAKVLDGGLTETGRPYFVMEYVKGIPITEYCDSRKLSVPERLQLFAQVCQAVQHAHQKGIIHRDLKPSNILVAPYDDKPVPKVIDFGLAKAMHQSLTENTLHTAHDMVLGTPLYMSPEQAQLNNIDIDTRSDIYSLGVLLYELLTGSTPLEKQRFKQAAWDEMRRMIREEDPPRPSHAAEFGRDVAIGGCRPAYGTGEVDQAGAWRAGLDRDEGAGEGPHAAIRDGQRLRGRRAALFVGGAGHGSSAERELPLAEISAQEQRRCRGGKSRFLGRSRWIGRDILGNDSGRRVATKGRNRSRLRKSPSGGRTKRQAKCLASKGARGES